jgi:peptide/nickel transport system permease protein/peptide/nickel transport system substrate-binding protein
VQRQEFIMEQLRQVGIRVRYSIGTIPEASAAFFGNEKKTDALVSAWTGRPDPSLTYSLMYLPDAYYNGGRGPVPDDLVQAIADSRATPDKAERKAAFSQVQKLVLDNALVCPLAFLSALDVAGDKVEGYKPNLLNKPKLQDVSLA